MSTGSESGLGTRAEAVGGALVAFGALCFGSIVVLGKHVLEGGITVYSLLAIRFGVGAVVLFAFLVTLRRPLAAAEGERAGLTVLAVCGYAVEATLFFAALRHGTAAAVTLLFFTYPVFVTLMSWVVGRGRPRRLTLVALGCAVAGAVVVVGTGAGLAIRTAGVLLALGAAVTFSAYLVGADRVLRLTSPLTSALWVSAGASIGLWAFAVITGKDGLPAGWSEWWPVLGMGVATAAAFVCLLEGVRRIGAVRTAIVSAMEPLAASVLALVFLGESVSAGIALGGALILVGAVTASLARAAVTQEPQIP
ncbi:MAG TPA: DMT family transporter [Actinomycetota bacterium]|nr:DMT family transporter [Actinomycetota bacterium]